MFLFCLFCLPRYLLPSYSTCCFFTRALFWVIGWWGWFLYGMGVREKRELWRQKGETGGIMEGGNPWGKAQLSAGEDKETQHKSTVNQPIVVLCETTRLKSEYQQWLPPVGFTRMPTLAYLNTHGPCLRFFHSGKSIWTEGSISSQSATMLVSGSELLNAFS